jgi:hypothetical protein
LAALLLITPRPSIWHCNRKFGSRKSDIDTLPVIPRRIIDDNIIVSFN